MVEDTQLAGTDELTEKKAAFVEKEKKALVAIRKLRRQNQQLEYRQREPIAIIGLSCRFPMASNADEFWRLLDKGVDASREVPPERWDVDSYYDPDPDAKGMVYTRRGYYLDKIDEFDAAFFGISPREAELMDPQQRILLEQAWCAVEDAGIAIKDLDGSRTGVFVGATASDYAMMIQESYTDPGPYFITGNTLNVLAGRLAYVLRLQGPAMAIDTACSSSLVSVHQACLSLRNGESNLVLAGGVNLMISPRTTIATCRAHMLSPDGHCKTFDASADGYARGEGCGMLVLKRLSDAERDGDRVLALVRGSAVNQDGRSSGLTVPNGPAQQKVIADALRVAGLSGSDVQYLEAHGTGTSLGDPIEIQSAAAALACDRDANAPLLVGSAKTNIGHLEAAAGVAGLIKVVLSLKHGRIPRHLHFTNPNPHIPWDELNLSVTAEAVPWPEGETPRIAGVNSFGFSGTNAHVVIEGASVKPVEDGDEDEPAESDLRMLTLSGRTSGALKELAINYNTWLEQHNDVSLIDICYTANTGRNHFEHRSALVFDSAEQLRKQLVALGHGGFSEGLHVAEARPTGARPKIAFLFTGQGSQYPGMGRDLYERETVFSQMLDRCATAFDEVRGETRPLGLLDVMFGEHEDELHQTGYTQPALFALEVSLAALWRSWGLEPAVVLGHSVGEYSAACVAGHFSVESGLALIAERSRLMQALPSGGIMTSVRGPAELVEAEASADDALCVAAYNGPECVLSGPQLSVEAAVERLRAQGHRCTVLRTSHAFHSALMGPMLEPFRIYADDMEYQPLQVPLVSNVNGEIMKVGKVLDATYWAEHVRSPVRFTQGIEALSGLGCTVVLELGPHPVLTSMGQQCWVGSVTAGETGDEPVWVASLRREYDDEARMLSAAADLFVGGIALDFAAMEGETLEHRVRVSLPTYPFQRKRYWLESKFGADQRKPALEGLFYDLQWVASASEQEASLCFQDRTWLILGSKDVLGETLVGRLQTLGARVVFAERPQDASSIEQSVTMNLDEATADPQRPLEGVLHLWGVDGHSSDAFSAFQAAQEYGVLSAHTLAQRLLDQAAETRLWLVTRGVHRVIDGESVDPTHAPVWGLGKSISLAHPEIWGGLADLPLVGDDETLVDQLLDVLRADDTEDNVTLRQGQRWVARLQPVAAEHSYGQLSVDPKASYLITGGLGALGLQLAGRLVDRGAHHLILSSRSAPSDAAEIAIQALQERGCQVRIICADVSREEDVVRLLDDIEQSELPALDGLFHVAGISRSTNFEELSHDQFIEVMAPKVWGGWLLDHEVRERGLDLSLFVCFSAAASLWGVGNQANYAAANFYLDALATHRRAEGASGCSINFGSWGEAGMAVDEEISRQQKVLGIRALKPSVALDALEAIVSSGVTQRAVVDVDWSTFKSFIEAQKPRPLLENLDNTPLEDIASTGNDSSSTVLESLRSASKSERPTLLATIIRDEVSYVLRTEPEVLSENVSWFELGMDSLMAMDVTNRLRRRFGAGALSVEVVYQQPTVGELKAALMKSLDLSSRETGVGEGVEVADNAGLSASDPTEWPASIGQKRVWFLQQMAPTSPQFNLPTAARFKKGLCVDLAERVLGELVRRHSALRTTIENSNGELIQVVQQWSMPELRVVDLSKDVNLEDRLKSIEGEEARSPIDIMGGSLIRFTLVNLTASDQVLLITMHHAISDGVSNGVILRELLALHEAFVRDEQSPLPQPEAQFVDYAVHESRQLLKSSTNDSVAYWKEELRGIPPLELPSDRVRPAVQTHVGDSIPVNLSSDIQDELRACSQRARVTPFITLLAAWSLLLSRYSGQKDFAVGTPVAGRDGPEWSDAIGFFVNMLTLRMQLDQDWTVGELLAHAKAVTKRAYEHQALPFDWLVEQLNPTRDPSRTPFFQAALILEVPTREFQERLDSEGIVVSDLRPMLGASPLDITLDLREKNTGFEGFLEYNTDLFDRWRMEQMVEHFKVLLSAMIRQPDAPISELPMSGSDEQQYLLTQWNDTARDYPLDQCVHERIAEQARQSPDEIAVACGEVHLTYAELNRCANQLAHYLQDRGVGPETLVGLCVDRSIDMVVAVLGVMKAGGAYVPLDPDFPKHRLELILEDADVKILLSQTQLLDRLSEREAEVICLDRDADRIASGSSHDPDRRTSPDNAVYVIYTSGSTGKPKGVVITHRSLLNFLFSMAEELAFDSQEILLAVTTLSFDISKLEILLPLLKGARVVIATREEAQDANLLRKVLLDNKATTMQATPATWRMLLASGWDRSEAVRVLCGGEALSRELAESLLEVTDSLWNVYGPTETTIWSAIQQVREMCTTTVPIGHPVANTQLYILDGGLIPSPVGVPGELFIGGDGLARGYLNQPDLTQERFVADPFAENSNARLYRTGDLCCRMPDGNIEFMGRLDNQVKVRGFRVEIGDIEDAMSACESIRQAAVTTWKGPDGFDVLVGYLVAETEHRPGVDEIKATLGESLPGYMVPGMLMYLDELPLTPNRKVDRRALPSPDLVREQAQKEFIAPQTEQEIALADIWKEVLKVETIGIRDNFFDLGGHSLQIVEILSKLKRRFEIEMSVVDLFQYVTIEALAEYLGQGTGKPLQSEEPGELPPGMGAELKVEEPRQYRAMDGRVYTYRRYCEKDRASALASYAQSFSQHEADVLDAAFEWKYLDSNSMPGDGSGLDVLDCDGEIVGMNGGVSARFKIEDNTIPGCWGGDSHVAPDHRVVSSWVWSEISRHSSGLKLSVPNENMYPILSETESVIDIDQYVTLVACLDLGAVLKARGWSSTFSSMCGLLFRPLPAILDRYTRARAATGIDVIEVSQFDERFDQLWQAVSRDYPAIMVRDQAFLSWRFDGCPIRNYTRYAAVREGEIVGYIVTRSYESLRQERGMIVDYLVGRNDSAVLSALIQRAMQDFRSRGAVSVKCSLSSSQREHIRQLRSHGFLSQRPGGHIVADRGFYDKSLAAIDEWFITYADGDIDYCSWQGDEEGVAESHGSIS